MLKPALDSFRADLRAAGKTALQADGKLVVERIVITAWPFLDSPRIERLRIEFPEWSPTELPWILNFFRSVWQDPEIYVRLATAAGAALKQQPEYLATVGGIAVRATSGPEHHAVEFAATTAESAP